jgi:chromosome segregation ATPase
MRQIRMGRGLGLVVLMSAVLLGLGGCDYWPPALQAQIEQLRADLQASTTERAKLESLLRETAQAKDQLQARTEELTRLNRELAARVQTLETSLTAEREKATKLTKGTKAAPAKGSAKASSKSAVKKKSTSKTKTKSKSKPKGT